MIAVDTNILVYAHREEMPEHASAKRRLAEIAESPLPWSIPVFCIGEFLRVISHPRLFGSPHDSGEACQAVTRLLASPSVRILLPGPRHWDLLAAAIDESGARGNVVFDAQIVAVCREAGASALLTADRDFDRFRGFRTVGLDA